MSSLGDAIRRAGQLWADGETAPPIRPFKGRLPEDGLYRVMFVSRKPDPPKPPEGAPEPATPPEEPPPA